MGQSSFLGHANGWCALLGVGNLRSRNGHDLLVHGESMNKEEVLDVALKLVFLVAIVWLTSSVIASATVGKTHGNSLGVPMYQENPMTYKAGSVSVAGNIAEGLVLRIQPLGTYELFTEDILICGHHAELFGGKTNPLVLTYRTKASRMIQSIGCHELINVDSLKPKESLGK